MKRYDFYSCPYMQRHLSRLQPRRPRKPWPQHRVRLRLPQKNRLMRHPRRHIIKITAEEAKQMMDEGNATVVDVRTAEEYAAGHIPGSILVPVESIGDTKPVELPDTEAVLLVHCRTGIRSKRASDQLVELGYKHVYDFGGIVDWPYETVTEN